MHNLLKKPLARGFFFQMIGSLLFSYGVGVASTKQFQNGIITSCALFAAIAFAGQITLAHFNPSVSIAYLINYKYPSIQYYILAQFIGATLGSLLYLGLDGNPFTPINNNTVSSSLDYIKQIMNQIIGSLFYAACVLVITNKFVTHANKSWQVYFLIPVSLFLIRMLTNESIINPSIGLPYQIISSIYFGSWQLFSYSWMLLIPSLLGGVLGGLLIRYIYQPLLLSIKFQKQILDK